MRALDTKVLARFFVDDEDDPQAARQRPLAIQALADALHVARSRRASGFASFDRRLAKRALGLPLVPPVEWLG